MKTVHFSSASSYVATPMDGVVTRLVNPLARNWFTAPERLKVATDAYVKNQADKGIANKALATLVKFVSGIAQKLVDYDFREFPQVALGKLKFKVAEPPIGAMMLLLYPFTMGPRLYRAYERGKKNNDIREVFDVLRRDGTAITIFLFMLKPLLKLLNLGAEKWAGLQLVDDGKVLAYSQFKNYKITNTEVLFRILEEKNSKGLLNAVKTLSDRGLSKQGDNTLQKLVSQLQKEIPAFVEKFHSTANPRAALQNEAENILKAIQSADKLTEKSVQQVGKGLSDKLLKLAKGYEGQFSDMLVNFAKTRRLPQDLISFAIVIGAIGWFPVWFNSQWNRKKFEEEQAKARAQDLSNFNPQITFHALKQSSRLSNSFSRMS